MPKYQLYIYMAIGIGLANFHILIGSESWVDVLSNVGKSCPITNRTWRKVGCYTRFFNPLLVPLSHPAIKVSFGSLKDWIHD